MQQVPWVVAHRAGNQLSSLERARRLGSPLIEADIHLFASRLEVRHRKTVGPLPILWDRWELAPPWAPRLLLGRLLAEAGEDVELMLDLKGRSRRLSGLVAAALAEAAVRRVTICSRAWSLLEQFRSRPGVRAVHSVGTVRQLRALRHRYADERLQGISIHRELLDAATVEDLLGRTELLLTWPVEDPVDACRLGAWGVHGVISRDFERLTTALSTELLVPEAAA
jgi:glycerophosphoryl diester phosphodiesterase